MSDIARLRIRIDRLAPAGVDPALTLLLLPAAATTGDDFVREGFLDDLQTHGLALTVVRSEVPLDLYAADGMLDLLRDEVLQPQRLAGRPLWLAGISLGGMTALACAESHPELIDGVCAIAPWPGPRPLWSGIAAGGLAAWARNETARFDDERRVWQWLGRGAAGCEVVIGYGRDDRFRDGQQRMSEALPPARRLEVDGGHDWPTWRALWQRFLVEYAPRWRVAGTNSG